MRKELWLTDIYHDTFPPKAHALKQFYESSTLNSKNSETEKMTDKDF